jgi:hypothetical protein
MSDANTDTNKIFCSDVFADDVEATFDSMHSSKNGVNDRAKAAAGKLGNESVSSRARTVGYGQVASVAADGGSLQTSQHQAGGVFPRSAAHAWLYSCHARRAVWCRCGAARPRRHRYDGKVLCASCAELRGRHNPIAFSRARHCGRDQHPSPEAVSVSWLRTLPSGFAGF